MKNARIIGLYLIAHGMCLNGGPEPHLEKNPSNPVPQAGQNGHILTPAQCAQLNPYKMEHLKILCNHYIATGKITAQDAQKDLNMVRRKLINNKDNG